MKTPDPYFNPDEALSNNTDEPTYSVDNRLLGATISEEVYVRIVAAVKHLANRDLEVGGQIKFTIKDRILRITDFNMPHQIVMGGYFEISAAEMAEWVAEHMFDEDFVDWRGWWHSHHNMSLFWSGTDDEQFDKLLEGREPMKDTCGIVFLSDGNFLCRYQVRTPFGTFIADDLPVHIEPAEERVYLADVEDEMREWCDEVCHVYIPKKNSKVKYLVNEFDAGATKGDFGSYDWTLWENKDNAFPDWEPKNPAGVEDPDPLFRTRDGWMYGE